MIKNEILPLVLIFVVLLVFCEQSTAQVPQGFNIQMVLRDAGGAPMPDESIILRYTIIKDSLSGIPVYQEAHNVTSNQFGLINTVLGIGSPEIGDFQSIRWYDGDYYLKQELDILDGNGLLEMGTTQLMTVPYAMIAGNVVMQGSDGFRYHVGVDEEGQLISIPHEGPIAGFYSNTVMGTYPHTVLFNDSSKNVPASWLWDFGDGSTSTEKNPEHTYSFEGNYTVTLTVNNDFGSDSKTIVNYIVVTNCPSAITDFDGNEYNTVVIGSQCWLNENLRVSHYPNGNTIPNVMDDNEWATLEDNDTDDAYCYYDNCAENGYGALYSYAAAIGDNWENDNFDGQGICPDGWSIPSDTDWDNLEFYLIENGFNFDGSITGNRIAKSMATKSRWSFSDNTGSVGYYSQLNNTSGFSGLPGGNRRDGTGLFSDSGWVGIWWSSTVDGTQNAGYRQLSSYEYYLAGYFKPKSRGFSVRCFKNLNIQNTPTAEFSATPISGDIPLNISFSDQSTNSPYLWNWDFGDGSTSTEQNPTHIYTEEGVYTVSLNVSNSSGNDIETKVDYIEVTLPEICPLTVTDIDGNIYNTVLIGTQCWMKENLEVTHYPNGDPIPLITDNDEWAALADNNTDDAYCFYDNNVNSEYGALYTYAAAIGDNWERDNVEGQGICPDGWHLPTDVEWKMLEGTVDTQYPVGDSEWDDSGMRGYDAGAHMKSTSGWDNSGNGDNSSGFTALAGGYRYFNGYFGYASYNGFWWSTMENSSISVWYRSLYDFYAGVYRDSSGKSYGRSVRCVRE